MASDLLHECRMVLPGLQALFGFQLVVVFEPDFWGRLAVGERRLHLIALTLVALSGALVMAPAAYHRQTAPREVSDNLLRISSRLLLLAMVALMLGICFDIYIIACPILGDGFLGLAVAVVLLTVFTSLWFIWPHLSVAQRRRSPR